jgi:predicted lipoprotein
MIKMKVFKIHDCLMVFAMVSTIAFTACDRKKKEEPTPESTFDKSGMLANMGDNIIVPAYLDLKISVDSMDFYCDQFISNPTAGNLVSLQLKFFSAYTSYQRVSEFEFGPAENELIRPSFNTFPCDTAQINSKISAGDLTLGAASDLDAKGFPAMDFLLYGINRDNSIVLAKFTTDANASNAKNYLAALVNELKYKTDVTCNAWSASGLNYISTFKNNTGSDVGSSIGMLVNQINYDLEILKNAKIGIPLGKKTLGTPLPEKVEAFYNTQSLALAAEHLKSLENIYLGKSKQGVDGSGLDDYVSHVEAQHPLGPLNTVIKNKFTSAKAKLALIPGTLSQAVLTNASIVDAAYLELQQLVVLLKVDMSSALGVMITYVDNDGD